MANLRQALELASLSQTKTAVASKTMTAVQIAKRVFQLAAQAGHPFEGITVQDWARKWLASDEFVLMEISASKAALTNTPKNRNLVFEKMHASAFEPIVVDANKNEIGRTPGGFVPSVIVVDGKHSHQAQVMQGKSMVMAWVGKKVVAKVQAKVASIKVNGNGVKLSKIESAAVLAQDRGHNGSAPHMPMPGVKSNRNSTTVYSGGPGSGRHPGYGQFKYAGGSSGSRTWYRFEHPDGTRVSALRYKGGDGGVSKIYETKPGELMPTGAIHEGDHDSNVKFLQDHYGISHPKVSRRLDAGAGGVGGSLGNGSGSNPNRMGFGAVTQDPSDEKNDPSDQSPGSGGGKRLAPSKGGSKSELQNKMFSKGTVVDKIYEACKNDMSAGKFKFTKKMMGVAPPGREEQVLKLKEKYGEDSPIPFQIAWHQHNQGKKDMDAGGPGSGPRPGQGRLALQPQWQPSSNSAKFQHLHEVAEQNGWKYRDSTGQAKTEGRSQQAVVHRYDAANRAPYQVQKDEMHIYEFPDGRHSYSSNYPSHKL